MNKPGSDDSTQLLQEIDRKMCIIESILQPIYGKWTKDEVYEMHQMILEISQLLRTLHQDPKMTPLAKGLSLQLQTIQEQYNRLFVEGEIRWSFSE